MRESRFVRWYLPTVVWGSLLLILTSLPKLTPPSLGVKLQDKIYHFVFYAVLGFLWVRAATEGNRARLSCALWSSLLYASLFAALDELHQLLIPGRFADFADFIANVLGLCAGIFLFKILFNRKLS
ncbi:MAG: VanZ like family protein [bacterium ADurb.Bin478]|nr:MAG: VanZ like family protein [bacterium ADurb.Bin478]